MDQQFQKDSSKFNKRIKSQNGQKAKKIQQIRQNSIFNRQIQRHRPLFTQNTLIHHEEHLRV